MDSIYQELWNVDQSENGLAPIRPDEPKDPTVGYVVVDERSTEVGNEHRVLKEVHLPLHKRVTYDLCDALFDNYALARAANEIIRPEEIQEELSFIDGILETEVIQLAREYMEQRLRLTISNDMLAAMIKETWFEIGRAGRQSDASGFEHVFVGEQASKAGGVGGYHFWYKYFLDDGGRLDSQDRIAYHGTRYHKSEEPDKGILVPEVVTLSLVWDAPAGDDAGAGKTLSKPIGGFFVGCSPEALIALGLVRCRTQAGKMANINGSEYQLDLHRLDGKPDAIRTFFPRFVKSDVIAIDIVEPPPETPPIEPPSPEGHPAFRMIAAMINPQNPEGGREFVQIINTDTAQGSLQGWKLIAPNGQSFEFSDVSISPGDVYKFVIPSRSGALRNSGGTLVLLDPQGVEVQRHTYTSEQTRNEDAVILV